MEKINKLAKQQEHNGQEITAIFQNLKRDPSKLTIQNYKEAYGQLEQCKEDVTKIHKNLEDVNEKEKLDSNHSYFKNKYYEQLINLHKDVKVHIKTCIENLEKEQALRETEQMRRLKEQEVRMEELEEILQEASHAIAQEKPKIKYERFIKEINRQWEIICNINIELKINESKFTHPYFTEKKFQQLRQVYEETIENLEEKVTSLSSITEIKPNIINNSLPPSNIKLPHIKIPFFDGKYEEWITFQDIFQKVVHNNASLSTIEKMQFLKTNVRGEASKTIQHFQITEVNYETAWTQLKARYENQRLIVNKLTNKILDLPNIQYESADKLKNMYNTVTECMEALKMLNVDTTSWGPFIECLLIKKWDSRTNELYESSLKNPMEVQSYSDLQNFLLRRFQAIEAAAGTKKMDHPAKSSQIMNKQSYTCKICESAHSIFQCQKFKALSNSERFQIAKEKKLCTICLKHEGTQNCTSPFKCKVCDKNHHTLLHRDFNDKNKETSTTNKTSSTESKQEKQNPTKVKNLVAQIVSDKVLLATALIKVQTASGTHEYLRALVDPGSQAAFISEMAATLLGLPRQKINAEVSGLGAGQATKCHSKISAICKPRLPSDFAMRTDFIIMPKVTTQLPEQELQVDIDVWQNKPLADPTFYKPGPIDVLLGAHEYRELLREGIQKTQDGLLGQNTEFGWIILGSSPNNSSENIKVVSLTTQAVQDEELAKFWEVEENLGVRELSENEKVCEEIYIKTTKRNDDGKYTVNIPFKNEIKLGDSRSRAMARLRQLEKRLANNNELDIGYKQFMQEYLDLGHMELVARSEENKGKYYIPHQAVIRESSSTTKLRVVFDASCKTSNNISLNEIMNTGARLQQDLSDIILRWRTHSNSSTC